MGSGVIVDGEAQTARGWGVFEGLGRKAMGMTWSELRRRVARLGAALDVVVRSDPEVCGLSGDHFHLSLHHGGQGDCTVNDLSLVDCPNELVLMEFERWMRGAGYSIEP
jgi:hypothetical protein